LTVGRFNREQAIAVAALGLLLVGCVTGVALSLQSRLDAVQDLSEKQDLLARLEARAKSRPDLHGPAKAATAPVEAFLDASTAGLASADLQAYVARLADEHATLVSFGAQPGASEDAADVVRIEASLDITLRELQVLLYELESGTPYVFVELMTIRTTGPAAEGGEDPQLRVTLGLRALWRRRAA
jgi:general secretion pathway protein M